MEFKISATSVYDSERLLEEYPALTAFDYEVRTHSVEKITRIRDENGNIIEQVDNRSTTNTPIIHLNTIDDLMYLTNVVGHRGLIVTAYDGDPKIEIYDDYRE